MNQLEKYLSGVIQNAISESISEEIETITDKVEQVTQEPYFTREKIKEMTGWSDRTLQHLRDTEQITYVQHGRKILYPRDEFYAFLEANKFNSKSQ